MKQIYFIKMAYNIEKWSICFVNIKKKLNIFFNYFANIISVKLMRYFLKQF
jgi:hypothetical protein